MPPTPTYVYIAQTTCEKARYIYTTHHGGRIHFMEFNWSAVKKKHLSWLEKYEVY